MWTRNDCCRVAKPIVTMIDKGWFCDVIGRIQGIDIFEELMESGNPE